MNKYTLTALALSLGIAFSVNASAEGLSKNDYKTSKSRISAEHTADKAACGSLSGNAKDVCIAEADGKEDTALAELQAAYKPTVKNHYKARVAKAEADYAVAKEKCDELGGNAQDVCLKEAKAAETTAKADAKVQRKTTDANDKAREVSADARTEANSETTEARKSAAAAKLDAEYAVAKEKCDTTAGSAKDLCLDRAKVKFGKS